jgi:hypothetical protein
LKGELMLAQKIKSALTATIGLMIVATTSFVAAPTEAEAGPYMTRDRCFIRGSAGERGRTMGVRNAGRLAANVWFRLGASCDQVDRFAQLLSEMPLAPSAQSGEFAACFYQGYTDQLYDSLDQTYDRCGTLCFNAGSEIGSISAQGYCAASVAVGGLLDPGFISQPPLPFCGASLVIGCKTQYVVTATRKFPGCSTYTQGMFAETFDNTVRQDCFVPADVPIRDPRSSRLSNELAALGIF